MTQYMNEDSENAFLDFPEVQIPEGKTVCNRCKGHGGWNLRLNAYPLHQYENTAENRHLYSHFRASCSSCWGHGFMYDFALCTAEGKYNGHDFDDDYTCRKCGTHLVVDSSD